MKAFILKLLSAGGPQAKKVAYLAVVLSACAYLAWDLRAGRITWEWVGALTATLGAVTGGYIKGKQVSASAGPAGGAVGSSAGPGDYRPEGTE